MEIKVGFYAVEVSTANAMFRREGGSGKELTVLVYGQNNEDEITMPLADWVNLLRELPEAIGLLYQGEQM